MTGTRVTKIGKTLYFEIPHEYIELFNQTGTVVDVWIFPLKPSPTLESPFRPLILGGSITTSLRSGSLIGGKHVDWIIDDVTRSNMRYFGGSVSPTPSKAGQFLIIFNATLITDYQILV